MKIGSTFALRKRMSHLEMEYIFQNFDKILILFNGFNL